MSDANYITEWELVSNEMSDSSESFEDEFELIDIPSVKPVPTYADIAAQVRRYEKATGQCRRKLRRKRRSNSKLDHEPEKRKVRSVHENDGVYDYDAAQTFYQTKIRRGKYVKTRPKNAKSRQTKA